MDSSPSCIYISDCQRTGSERLIEVAKLGCAAGLDAIILREKTMSSGKLLALASELRAITSCYGSRLIVHGAADIARAVNADGVHLAAEQIDEVDPIRKWWRQSSATISVSCHNADELGCAARIGADFSLLSPLFPTASHPEAKALGVTRWQQLAEKALLPVIALGGISVENREQIHGHGIAVMRAIDEAADIVEAVRSLMA